VTCDRSVVFSIQHYVIKFVSDLRQVGGFLYTTLCDKVLSVTCDRSVVFSIQHYVIKFVSDLRQVGGFLYTTLCDKVCQWLATGRWFSSGSPVSSTNKADRHDITDILLKVALNTIKQINKQNHIVKPGKNIVGNRGHKQIYVKGKKIHCHLRNEYYVTGHTVHDDDRIIS
jgi:hypothetical protein